jgi:PilZ domain-containing protein
MRTMIGEQRGSIRFNKVFEVMVSSEDFGEITCVARNISLGGMLIETPAMLPLGSQLSVRFPIPDSDGSLVARAEVKNHYVFNYVDGGVFRWARGMGVRFVEFLEDGDKLRASLGGRCRARTLH